MTALRLAAIPMAAALACTFDGTGLLSVGPDSSTSSAGSTSTDPASTTTNNPPTTDGTTDAPTTVDPSDGSSTTAVDPSSTGATLTTGAPVCGDGVQQDPEACDGTDLADQTCESLGLPGGTLACSPTCAFDFAGCTPLPTCDNGVLDPGEECDGDVGGKTCLDFGFDLGELLCTACKLDTSQCVGVPDDWYSTKYGKRRKLTIAKDKLQGVLTDFPVVLAITDMDVVAGLAPASKLVFADPAKKLLSHELELDEAGRMIAWIELDLDAAADEVFYVYYGGDPNAPDTEKPIDTWSNKFLGVWHLDEKVPNEEKTGVHPDVTGNGRDGTQNGNEGIDSDCRIGLCQNLGVEDFIDFAKPNEFDLGDTDATLSIWFRNSTKAACSLFAKSDPSMPEDAHLIFGALADGKLSVEQLGAGKLDDDLDVFDNKWHQLVWTQTRDFQNTQERWTLYVDGVEANFATYVGKPTKDPHKAGLGGPTANSLYPSNCQGAYDEVHISLDDRSPDWIATAYANQSAPTTFVAVGPEEQI